MTQSYRPRAARPAIQRRRRGMPGLSRTCRTTPFRPPTSVPRLIQAYKTWRGREFGCPRRKYIRETLINSAVDAALAGGIFGCLSSYRSPQLIELWLNGAANIGTEAVAWELLPVLDLLPPGWLRTRDAIGRGFSIGRGWLMSEGRNPGQS